jgi:hypothetical protein
MRTSWVLSATVLALVATSERIHGCYASVAFLQVAGCLGAPQRTQPWQPADKLPAQLLTAVGLLFAGWHHTMHVVVARHCCATHMT